ncbi:TfoX/Sxy family protein [Litoreibacter roseus]|uniref:Competence protein TfoX n=1 Tax=Litoreibacter roseus TaxID=2601869 RepID=A0A6N6JIR3_9RHOB|nr:TfoX/Sxy family protein [Litoreibacter roseus]GFE65837.1 competence protein TfoX [Litoreibacter roseus]
MSLAPADIEFALELFSDIPNVTTRKMMGGLCLYSDGTIFAVLRSDGQLLVKAKGDVVDTLEAEGGIRWTHTRKNGTKTSMPYWTVPDQYLDDHSAATDLARRVLHHL